MAQRGILPRRIVLLLPLLLPALLPGCGDDEAPPSTPETQRDFPPLRYGYLPPIPLNVQRVEVANDFTPPTGDNEMIGLSPIDPVETLNAMARDRLQPVGPGGVATFHILAASIRRHGDAFDGLLAVRLDVHDADDTNSGFAEARVTATRPAPTSDRRGAIYDMLKSMMFDMNVELEYQIRNKLKGWVADMSPAAAKPAAAPAPDATPPAEPTMPVPPVPPSPPA